MAMRQMTQFSMVSSNWDDSLGSRHLPGAIYALAGTARGETAACSHPRPLDVIRSHVRALAGRSRFFTAARVLDLSLIVVEQFVADIENFMLTNHKVYNYVRANYCM